jgi:hypothetical protein
MSFFKLKTIAALSAVLLIVGCNKTEMASQAQGGSRMKVRVRMGIDDCRLSLASFALLPEPCERVAESGE